MLRRSIPRHRVLRAVTLAAFTVLLGALVFVVVVLPDLVAQREPAMAPDEAGAGRAPEPASAPQPDAMSVAKATS